ncbi:MAG: DUF4276 family protein [Burkholderiales bacterium]|nr:DUF4276 family protein [Burkholderiales bacterium]
MSSKTLDTKINLLRDAGKVAAQLLNDGCSCVIILWDLRPAWPDGRKPCRYAERQALLTGLTEAGVPLHAPVYLVCIEQELESWLLGNNQAIAALLSTKTHPYRVSRIKKPDAVVQPKAALIKHFKNARGWRYDDKVDAIRVLRAADVDLGQLRRSTSFSRFENKVTNCVGVG